MGQDGYASLSGMIQNSKEIDGEDEAVDKAASEIGTEVIGRIPRDKIVQQCESAGKTVAEGAPHSKFSSIYDGLADEIVRRSHHTEGGMREAWHVSVINSRER